MTPLQPVADLIEPSRESRITGLFPYERINLNPGTLGSQPLSTAAAVEEFLSGELAAFPLGQYQLGRKVLQALRKRVALVWGQPEDAIAIPGGGTTAIVNAIATALFPALAVRTGRSRLRFMTSQHEHYGAVHGFEHHRGYEVGYFEDEALKDPVLFRECVSRRQPDIILLSQLTYDAGWRIPVEELALAVRDLPCAPIFIADAAQSMGLLPSLPSVGKESGIDLVAGSCHKWMMGPQGTGLMWMSDRLANLIKPYYCAAHPLDEEANLGVFEASGGQDFAKLAALKSAVELYAWVGPEEVAHRSRELARHFHRAVFPVLEDAGLKVTYLGPNGALRSPAETESDDYSGMLVIRFEEWDAYPLYDHLNAQQVHTKLNKIEAADGTTECLLRLGFPYYESKERIDSVVEKITAYLRLN